MSINEDFKKFLSDIEPSGSTVKEISSTQQSLRDYLSSHEVYSKHHLTTYLSGSYAKHTAIRPAKGDENRDVDIIVETNYTIAENSAEVLRELRDVLLESDKYSSARLQTHSVGIQLSNLDIDVVPLVVKDGVYYIGNSETGEWKRTNPKRHKEWSSEVNGEHDGKYKPVVKIIKWWRREHCPEGVRWPKGITLEKMIADNFPEESAPYDDLVMSVFRSMHDCYADDIEAGSVPVIRDPALSENNLALGYCIDDFRDFDAKVQSVIGLLDGEGSTDESWREILGGRFPSGSTKQAFSLSETVYMPVGKAVTVGWRDELPWPLKVKGFGIQIMAEAETADGQKYVIHNNDQPIPKGCEIIYHALRRPTIPDDCIRWQIVNTGEEAAAVKCLRGEIVDTNEKKGSRKESTAYTGRHYVQCFAVLGGRCIARSKEFFINVE